MQSAHDLLDMTPTEWYGIEPDDLHEMQRVWLDEQFSHLVEKVPVLKRLAEGQKITKISSIDDGAPLLFAHSVYKSYPLSVLDNGQFDRLTKWLSNLTTLDLSHVRSADCETIDDWVDALDAQTDVRIVHSSGTTGKLSFMPRSTHEGINLARAWPKQYMGFGDEPNSQIEHIERIPVISAFYRRGGMGQSRMLQTITQHVYKGHEDNVVVMNPGRLSADMLSLAGRIRNAEAKGNLGKLQITTALMARRDAFIDEQRQAPERRLAFMREIAERFRGKRVILSGLIGQHYDVAMDALEQGWSKIFAPNSLIAAAGGLKGRVLPDNYMEKITDCFGVPFLRQAYGMSEMTTNFPACPEGRFHIPPFIIPYVLDPKTGAVFERTGTQTGRLGLIDLLTRTYWGGFLSGDRVTITWDEPCPCGRKGAHLHPEIRRFSEVEGGDDKVTCAGAPEAHDEALAILNQL